MRRAPVTVAVVLAGALLAGCCCLASAPGTTSTPAPGAPEASSPHTATAGIPEQTRRAIFLTTAQAEADAQEEGDRLDPIEPGSSAEEVMANTKTIQRLQAEAHDRVMVQYDITAEQLGRITEEGIANGWPKY